MKAIILAMLVVLAAAGGIRAEENPGWRVFAKTGLALTESDLSDNWAGSETGSIAWTWTLLGEAEKQLHPKVLCSNSLNTAFGQTHQHDPEADRWQSPIKSTDKIRLDSVLRFTLGGWVDPYVAGYVKTQFYDEMAGLDDEILNPAVISEAFGLAHAFCDTESRKLVTRAGLGLRQNRNAFAPDKVWTHDGGVEWVTDAKFAGAEEKTVYVSKLTVYKALFYSDKDALKGTPMEDYWKSPDLDWENTWTNKLSEWLSFDLYFQLVYDKEQSKRGQYKQTLGAGLVWQFL